MFMGTWDLEGLGGYVADMLITRLKHCYEGMLLVAYNQVIYPFVSW